MQVLAFSDIVFNLGKNRRVSPYPQLLLELSRGRGLQGPGSLLGSAVPSVLFQLVFPIIISKLHVHICLLLHIGIVYVYCILYICLVYMVLYRC